MAPETSERQNIPHTHFNCSLFVFFGGGCFSTSARCLGSRGCFLLLRRCLARFENRCFGLRRSIEVFIWLTTWWLADATRASLLFLERAVAIQPVPGAQQTARGSYHQKARNKGCIAVELGPTPPKTKAVAPLLKNIVFPPVDFKGNRFHYWTFFFSSGLKQMECC